MKTPYNESLVTWIMLIVWLIFCFLIIECAVALADENDGVSVTTTITDDSEDWNVTEYSLPINNQHSNVVELKTEYTEVKNQIEQKENPILPTGYSILVKDTPDLTSTNNVYQDPFIKIKCQKIQEKINQTHTSEFDKIDIQHEQYWKNRR